MLRVYRTTSSTLVPVLLCALGAGCSVFGGRSTDELASIDDVMGPTERRLQTVSYETDTVIASRSDDPALRGAEALFDEGKYAEAEKAYKDVHSKYRPDSFKRAFGNPRAITRGKSADERAIEEYGSPIEQECLFKIAECQFAQKKFPKAEESYQLLLRRYPSTPHLDTVAKRIYAISRHWLGFPPVQVSGGPGYDENQSDIQQVVFTDVEQSIDPTVAPESSSWLNLTDGTKPRLDATGRALNSLKTIWLNDPTGPLADDALILTANHYYRNGDPVEAARYYELLREQYPDSPHLKNAYLLESHVKLTSYAGDLYDDKSLQQAQQLKQASLQIFPELSEEQRQLLRQELAQIEDAKVAREWALVELYRTKGRPEAVRLYCNSIINEHPDSRYADLARDMLGILSEEDRNGGQSWWPFARNSPKVDSPTIKPVALAPVDLKSQPETAIASGTTTRPARTASNSGRPQNFAQIFNATPPTKSAVSPTEPTANPFAAPTVQPARRSIQQVGGSKEAGNPFAEFMQADHVETKKLP